MLNGNAENKIHLSAAMMASSHSFFCHVTAKETHVYCADTLISAGFFWKNRCPWQYILKSFSFSVPSFLVVCPSLFLKDSAVKICSLLDGFWSMKSAFIPGIYL